VTAVFSHALNPIAIHAFNPGPMTGEGNWTWLVPGRVPTLIDAGAGDSRHLAALRDALDGSRLAQVLVTHAHTDHMSGAPALAALDTVTRFRKMPWPERDGRWPAPWSAVADGEAVEAGDTTLLAVHTPGHAPDHLCFWHAETRTIFGGDLVLKGTTVYIPTSLGGDLSAYLASLDRIRALRPQRILPAHGSVIEDPDDVIRRYIEHRFEREAQVLAALDAGHTTPDAIVREIYRFLPQNVLPLARESVLAHLAKLEAEGRAGREAAVGVGEAVAESAQKDTTRWHRISQ
jgi:glyoxylase-like metal-dependent hydrolase (beta-lactamase superfamily II)